MFITWQVERNYEFVIVIFYPSVLEAAFDILKCTDFDAVSTSMNSWLLFVKNFCCEG